jgi:histidine ammonia-lyase
MVAPSVLLLDGSSLTCGQTAAAARGHARVGLAGRSRERARAAAAVAARVSARREVYGRTTGVGANRGLGVVADDLAGHGLRLIRSHAGGGGPLMAPELGLAMLTVRANQIAAGGSGVDPGVLDALADCVNRRISPPVPVYGAIGTGDLTALAVTALCLRGEREWLHAPARPPRFALESADALAFISSNAATLGEAALACNDLGELLRAAMPVAALSHLATDASTEPYAAPVHEARPHPGQRAVAEVMRRLLAGSGGAGPGGRPPQTPPLGPAARIQDPYGYRAFPQVHGPVIDAAGSAEQTITVELNARAENPLIDVGAETVWHNGNFHTAYVGLALDAVRAAVFQAAALSAARLGTLVEPAFTGLPPFLATDPPPSSGIMILEYVSHSAIADIRRLAAPAALGSAVLSRGVEEHAGFSTQSARATTDVVAAYRIVLACELVASVRALRLRGLRPVSPSLAEAFHLAVGALPAGTADRPLDGDLASAERLLPALAAVASAAGG